ncbi:hypothetical protein [Rhodococcus sp. NPDC003348]
MRRNTTDMTAVDVVGYVVLDDIARRAREWCETIAAKRAEFASAHPFDLPAGRIVSGGAM